MGKFITCAETVAIICIRKVALAGCASCTYHETQLYADSMNYAESE